MLACAIVPPVPVPYREALFARLAARDDLAVKVIYQASAAAGWDQAEDWFPIDHGYESVRLGQRQLRRAGRSPIIWPRGLERALRDFSPDVVVVSEFGPATLRALAWCRARRRALVVLSEVSADVERSLPAAQRRLHGMLASRVDGLIAVSTAARRRLLALGADPERVTVSLQPVDEDALRIALAAERARHRDGGPVEARHRDGGPVEVLTVARLVPDKGIEVLLDAFAASGLSDREARLSIAGGGPLRGQLETRARALGVDARFLGALPAAELPRRYAQAHAFVLPSHYEPFGVALREAVVAGLPVICSTAVGAAEDFALAGRNAILVAPGDVRSLSQALARLCRDTAFADRMGAESERITAAHPLAADVESFARAIGRAARRVGRGGRA